MTQKAMRLKAMRLNRMSDNTDFKGSEVYWDDTEQAYIYERNGIKIGRLNTHKHWWMEMVSRMLCSDHGPAPLDF